MEMQTDSELISLTRQGHKAAFGVLVERYMPMITHLTRRMVNDPELAHDLAQDAFLEAFLSLEYLRDPGRFRSWLYGLALNVCRSYQRSPHRDTCSLEELSGGLYREPSDGGPTPEEIIERLDLWRTLLNAVQRLSPPNQAAVLLVYYEERSLREAAGVLGISLSALKGRLYKARLHLQATLRFQVDPIKEREGVSTMIPVKVGDVRRRDFSTESGIPIVSTQIVL